ncbi:heptaprenyl diphosphate synthase component II [Caldalkalibacillus thermarum TA2.A1]|uniref:Heptaprenyl diphosphate synthase component II n=1 Tax=Caldalkalibacillus thermarum (strain TA2.A1) TaxID=986075 RepID=F5L723_CALTT|nr:heptaprenyl diphosphate synthase component II [Caldalkalibacillus thermarum]EGL82858.1 heptaprenyl diphosphate synthase component II [Caldalkalibacillus thermarum TA2.A1]QZT32712.1 heptaprenyl diphosphate synthase component II [Caldalkalibacillus thermarum TA2.A1]
MNLMDIYQELKDDIHVIEQELFRSIDSHYPLIEEAASHLLKAGGKRIRPVFVLLGGKSGVYDIERLKHVAVALELIHMATLVHDDVIDDAETRRGKPTVKAKWDNRVAMYTGDFIFAQALSRITRLSDPRVHQILSKAIVDMCVGEIEQIQALYQWNQSLKTYFMRIKRKTALLMAISCQLGGLVCNAPEPVVRALYRYGYYVGMAFQITDDILDFTGSEKQLGKPAGSDLRQGNITLPVLASFRNPAIRDAIINEFKSGSPDMPKIINLIKQSGGIHVAKTIAQRYLEKARRSLEDLQSVYSKKTFIQITDFIEQRTY